MGKTPADETSSASVAEGVPFLLVAFRNEKAVPAFSGKLPLGDKPYDFDQLVTGGA